MSESIAKSAERTFFDRRYTFPGYSFVLWVVVVNRHAILPSSLLGDDSVFLSVFLGFVTVLSGAPIGFLVSQTWYRYFNRRKRHYVFGPGRPYERLREVFLPEVQDSRNLRDEDRVRIITVANHITNTWPVEKDDAHVVRRWDLLNLIGSTGFAIFGSVLVGFIVKLWLRTPYDFSLDLFADTLLVIGTVVLLFILLEVYDQILEEHLSMLDLIIWESMRNEENIDRLGEYFH